MPEKELCLQPDVQPIDPTLDTLPKNLLAMVRTYGPQVAMRKKRYGIWQEYTWQESYQHVHDFALGLMALGVQRGDKISIIGDNDPEYFWAEMAAHAAGMTTIGVFTDASAKELEYVLHNSDSVLVVAQDQEQVDKMLELRERLPQIVRVVYWDAKGLYSYREDWLMSFQEVEAMGREYAQKHPNAFETSIQQGKGTDYAIFSYTSGTTGLPKAAMITHLNLLYAASRQVPANQRLRPGDEYVSFSPMSWIAEQGFGLTSHLVNGMTINFPEKAETVRNDIREIAPHQFLFPSRLWESIVSEVQARMTDAGFINRFLYRTFLPVGYKIADLRDQRQQPNLWWQFLYFIGNLVLFAPLRDKLGLRRLRFAYTSGALLSPDALRFFRALNVELLQLYGSTEGQTHTNHFLGDVRLGTVGQPPPGVRVKVTEEGEIAVKSQSVFAGYYKAPEKTAEVVRDGWYYTGDAGFIDENNHLIYLDRVSDMIQLASGDKFSPQYIEGRMKFSPYIQDVMAVGSFDMPFVSALVTINFDNVARWAEKRGIAFTTQIDLSQKPQVYDLIAKEIERVNAALPPKSRIRRFVILHKSFDADEAELTRTRKLRRRYLEQRYGEVLSGVYGGANEVEIESEIVYQDGRKATTRTKIHIQNVGDTSDLPIVKLGQQERVAEKA